MLIKQILSTYRGVIAALSTVGLGLLISGCTSGPSTPVPVTAPTAAPVATAPPSKYENRVVRRPGNTPEDSKVYIVQNGKKRWVVNASWFAANGFKFPDSVEVITAAELDTIPTGDPIQ
jgi:hypothetical protein